MEALMTVRECYELVKEGSMLELDTMDLVQVQGWVRTNRNNKNVGFIELNDGTYFRSIQLVYASELEQFEEATRYLTGTALTVIGSFKLTPGMKQPFEIEVKSFNLEGACDPDYPLQKKQHSFEYLREIAHLRPRTNTFSAVFRVRSVLSMAIHEFFQDQGFVYLHAPIITGNDAEGAGEVFTVTTRNDANYEEDFFGKKASLTVSGQLQAEAFALAFRDVYTFGPTFRAENSNTARHASEFWMIEPEIAFADLADDMDLIEDMVKSCIQYVLDNAEEEMKFFNERIDKSLLERLDKVLNMPFARMTYTEAIEHLKEAPVIINGKPNKGIGGGMCQVSSTIYNAALYSGLKIINVRNHSIPSPYIEKGRDATVSVGCIDLKFLNPILLAAELIRAFLVIAPYRLLKGYSGLIIFIK